MKEERADQIGCILIAASIAATAYAFALTAGDLLALDAALAFAIATPVPIVLLTKRYYRLNSGNMFLWLILSAILLLSFVVNSANYSDNGYAAEFAMAHVFGIISLLLMMQWTATNFAPELILSFLALMLTPLIGLALLVSLNAGAAVIRAAPFNMQPNWWGELCFAYVLCSMAVRSLVLRYLYICLALWLLYLVQSRGSLLAVSLSLLVFFGSAGWPVIRRNPAKVAIIIALLAIIGLVLTVWRRPVNVIGQFVVTHVLLLDDPYRGLGTGFTGRITGWIDGINVFFNNPLLGRGIDTLDSVHNGYIQLAGEGGITLFTAIVIAVVAAVVRCLSTGNRVALSIVISYLAYVFFAPRMLNMNIASALFFLAIFRWKRRGLLFDQSRQIQMEMNQ